MNTESMMRAVPWTGQRVLLLEEPDGLRAIQWIHAALAAGRPPAPRVHYARVEPAAQRTIDLLFGRRR